jgi:hypothetical protein
MWRKIFYLIVFGLFLVYLGRFLYFTKIVENVCSQVAGVGVRELRGIINDRDLRFSGDYSDHGIIHTTKNFGRGVCVIKLEEGVVKEAIFDVRD